MAEKRLNKTYSTWSGDPIPNRAYQVRRDNDKIKTPKCTIEDVDFAMISYIQDIIKPYVIENGQKIDVPVMYANGEKWAQVQARGYMRDRKGKIMTPVISIRRNSITERDTLKTLGVNQNPLGNNLLIQNKHTIANQYDRFSIMQKSQKKKLNEYYVIPIPEFIDVSYEILLWTEYTEQMNFVVEQIMPQNGFAWGTTWKFPTYISDYSFETTNATGEDRVVRCTLPITAKGALLMESELRESTIKKAFSVKKVKFTSETDAFDVIVDRVPKNVYGEAGAPFAERKQDYTNTETSNEQGNKRSIITRRVKGIRDLANRPHAGDKIDNQHGPGSGDRI